MNYIADLHVHSHYSRATSKASHLYGLAAWAAVKGIGVVGTGDFTHPGWFAHLHDCLEPAEPGLYRLKTEPGRDLASLLPHGLRPTVPLEAVRFVLSAEISLIYKRGGRVRKVHNLLYVPDLDSARRVNATLATLGNIASDGRPILGLDARDLLEILLEKAPDGFLVPAHIWTPWFSLFGSKSGFDSLEECFGDLSHHIFALETGLSSDPEMNRLISALDRYTLISNSDCHSPAKLGREANIFSTGFDYFSLRDALRSPVDAAGRQVFAATVEFYPEEGKYHCNGHRTCQICLDPHQTREAGDRCPVCGKPLTIGVLHRVLELADRTKPFFPPGSPRVHSLVPLQEMVAELVGSGPASKKAVAGYVRLINLFGSEFGLLLETPVEEIRTRGGELLAEAIERVRTNRVIRKPGYDGQFGVITVFAEGERARLGGQADLFGQAAPASPNRPAQRDRLARRQDPAPLAAQPTMAIINSEQQRAVESCAALIVVQAGPGTGKTHTLVSRVKRVSGQADRPCTVITFTNKAAAEVRERLGESAGDAGPVTVATFHGYCLAQLRRFSKGLQVVGPEERDGLLEDLFPRWNAKERASFRQKLTETLRRPDPAGHDAELHRYLRTLEERMLIDIEAVVPSAVALLGAGGEAAEAIRSATGHLFVDEFQDVNEAQFTLVRLLAQTSTVFAIGDPDQAIYGFRGSEPRWFHAFIEEMHPEVHQLVRNYRSGATIVRAAEQLIGHNPHPLPPQPMHPCAPFSGIIHRQECSHPEQEAAFIADQIEIRLGGTSHRGLERFDHAGSMSVSLRDIGVLYRTGHQGEVIGAVLTERGIPFQLVDLEAYYTKGECRLLYCWLLLLAGLAEPDHLLVLLEKELALGGQTLRLIRSLLRQAIREQGRPLADLPIADGPLGAVLEPFHSLLARMRELAESLPTAEVLAALIDHHRFDPVHPDLVRLREASLTFGGSLAAFADHLHRFSDGVVYDPRAEAVTLSTLHAAKGLEFAVVFIAGCEEGLLPLAPRHPLAPEAHLLHLEEERRLMYVGMTRAAACLTCTWCRSRSLFGGPAENRGPSSFFDELPDVFTPPPTMRRAGHRRGTPEQLSLFS